MRCWVQVRVHPPCKKNEDCLKYLQAFLVKYYDVMCKVFSKPPIDFLGHGCILRSRGIYDGLYQQRLAAVYILRFCVRYRDKWELQEHSRAVIFQYLICFYEGYVEAGHNVNGIFRWYILCKQGVQWLRSGR